MPSPIDTVNELSSALNRGDVETALMLYEPDAVLIAQPGRPARGSGELRAALAQFVALKPTLRTRVDNVVEVGDLALYIGRWTLHGTDASGQAIAMGGESSDVLRKQADGRWLIAIDNPWGARVLESQSLEPVDVAGS
jgi:uncharacterized protein (TIGR02246 family)